MLAKRFVHVIGVDFVNLGAYLMLVAIQQWARQQGMGTALPWRAGSYFRRRQTGCWTTVHYQRSRWQKYLGPASKTLGRALPAEVRRLARLVNAKESIAVLDASGFVYSDVWSESNPRRMMRWATESKREGRPVVLLPQAFGPFHRPAMRQAVREMLDVVDLVFARDQESLASLVDLFDGDRPAHIRRAPDFTCLVEGRTPSYADDLRGRACIIPSNRMLTHTSGGKEYLLFLVRLTRLLKDAGLEPFILLHELEADREVGRHLLRQSVELLGSPLEVIEEPDAVTSKGLIGVASLVITSRFHALASALYQGVPAVATSWSHKYAAILGEYEKPEWLVSPRDGYETVASLIEQVRDQNARILLTRELIAHCARQRSETKAMWAEVERLLAIA